MTYHFINLVSWGYFDCLSQNQKRYLDSFSIRLLAFLFGVKSKKVSGVSYYHDNRTSLNEALYLVAKKNNFHKHQLELPYWEDEYSVEITHFLREEIKKFQKLVIGISSPKQDALAIQIQSEFPQKEIYCLGAAIYTDLSSKRLNIGFLWIFFLFSSPNRTMLKLKDTFHEFFSILLNMKKRKQFKLFLRSLDSL